MRNYYIVWQTSVGGKTDQITKKDAEKMFPDTSKLGNEKNNVLERLVKVLAFVFRDI